MIKKRWELTALIYKIYVLMSAYVDIKNNDVCSHKDVLINLINKEYQ